MIEALITAAFAAIVVFLLGFITEDAEAAVWMPRRAGLAVIAGLILAVVNYIAIRIRRRARDKRLESLQRD